MVNKNDAHSFIVFFYVLSNVLAMLGKEIEVDHRLELQVASKSISVSSRNA